ncbi:hypothetical protein CR513_47242, partial [Mucuna pruriens]
MPFCPWYTLSPKTGHWAVKRPKSKRGLWELVERETFSKDCEKRLEEAKGRWVEELLQVLWSYHTTLHSATHETSFYLTFGIDAMILVEVEESSSRATSA